MTPIEDALDADPSKVVLIVGAGFSRHVNGAMPLTFEVGRRIMEQLSVDEESLPLLTTAERSAAERGLVPYDDLEVWLSSLAAPQPYHSRRERFRRAALFDTVAARVADEIRRCEAEAKQDEPPEWLRVLASSLHFARSSVITFNYDTLLEATIGWLNLWGPDPTDATNFNRVQPHSLVGDLPPAMPVNGRRYSDLYAESFRLHKLHGSTTWFGRQTGSDDLYSIIRDDRMIRGWAQLPTKQTPPIAGLENIIVPPIADKSQLYNNSTIATIWADAATALRNASTVALLGYSLPSTDYSAVALLGENVPPEASVVIVNPDHEPIANRVAKILPSATIASLDSINDFVDSHESAVARACVPAAHLEHVDDPATVIVFDSSGQRRRILEIRDSIAIVGDVETMNPVQPGPTVEVRELREVTKVQRPDGRTALLFATTPRDSRFTGVHVEFRSGCYR